MIKVPVEPGTEVLVDGKVCKFLAVTQKDFMAVFEDKHGIPFRLNIFDANITAIGSNMPIMKIPQPGK